MHLVVKRGLGLLAFASLLAACAATSDKSSSEPPTGDEHEGTASQALGEMACTQLGSVLPATNDTGIVTATQTNGCNLTGAVISPTTAYGFAGCPNQYVWNITHVYSTANNPVIVVPHANIAQADCGNSFVTLGIYARDDHQNNPWTLLGTTTASGTWTNGVCTFDAGGKNQLNLPTTSAYTSYILAGSAWTNTYWKGVATPNYQLVYMSVRPTC